MADVTGRIYEAFTEFLLRRLEYRDEWTPGTGSQYLYEKHRDALCHTDSSICPHAADCDALARQNQTPYGPWYKPDFLVVNEADTPVSCLHVTHWSNPRDSHRKFWRTVEDHFQFKTLFGPEFLSVNLVFVALRDSSGPRIVRDTKELLDLAGWAPTNGTVLSVSFDATLLFPVHYPVLEAYAAHLNGKVVPAGPRQRRRFYNEQWELLCGSDPAVRSAVDTAADLLRQALSSPPHPRYPAAAVRRLQDVCFRGRQRAVGVTETASRYRKGIQHAFILREAINRHFGKLLHPDLACWNLLNAPARLSRQQFAATLGLPPGFPTTQVDDFIDTLASIPVQMDQRQPLFLLDAAAGVGTGGTSGFVKWNDDLALFLQGLTKLATSDRTSFQQALTALFSRYLRAQGMGDVLADLSDPQRIVQKVQYVRQNYVGVKDKAKFVGGLAADLLTPGARPSHQQLVPDVHNWVADLMLEFYDQWCASRS
jgi:hypothetical protein